MCVRARVCDSVLGLVLADHRPPSLLFLPQLKKELAGASESVYDTEKLSERIAKLSGGVAVIKVRGRGEAVRSRRVSGGRGDAYSAYGSSYLLPGSVNAAHRLFSHGPFGVRKAK